MYQRTTGVAATGAGTVVNAGDRPPRTFSVQVKGTGAAPTAWTVDVEGSLDNANWTVLGTHGTADVDGKTKFIATDKPVIYVRYNVTALTLGGATAIEITLLGL